MTADDRRRTAPAVAPALVDELATLGLIGTSSGHARTRGGLANAALDILRRATGATAGLILFNAGEGYSVVARYGLSDGLIDQVRGLAREGSPLFEALEASHEPLVLDTEAAPFRPEFQAAARAEGIEVVALVGLRIADEVVGALGVGWHGARPAPDATALLPQTAGVVAVALQNAVLVERLEAALSGEQRLVDEQEALQSLTQIAETSEAFDELARRTLRQVTMLLGARGAAYALLEGDVLRYAATEGIPEEVSRLALARPAGEHEMVRRLRDGEGSYFEPDHDAATTPETMARVRCEAWTAYAAIPIRVGDQLEGVIGVYFDRPLDELHLDRRGLDAIGRIAAISLANFRLKERLSNSEERYRALFEQSSEALALVSERGEVVAANGAALRLFGTELARLASAGPLWRLLEDGDGRPIDGAAELADGEPIQRTARRSDGTAFPAEVTVTRLRIEAEARSLVLIRDLTDEERLQAELLQAQKMEALGQLVSGVAHELNNPLASIVAFSQLIRGDERLPADLRNDAELLQHEADRTRRIVRNLLDFARRRPPERVTTSVRALVDSVLELQSYGLSSASVTVEVDIPRDVPTIDIDRGQLQQVLLNLTLNAIQAIRSAGRPGTLAITAREVRLESGVQGVRLAVADDGPGVAPELRSRLFVPFFTTREPGEGKGLGLSVSFGIVAAHGGRLWFEPGTDERGAIFLVELPVHAAGAQALPTRRPDPAPSERASGPRATPRDPSDAVAPPRVLVLDDEPSIRAFLSKALKLAHLDPIVVQRGEEAVETARSELLDAVLVDHRMPGMTGTDVYEAIVAIRPELAERFVFMSGDVLNPELQRFAAGREIALLSKPFDVETVQRVINDVIRRA